MKMRKFHTGATRSAITSRKYDYEGFLSPLVLKRFAQYMNKHRRCADGSLRESDNWQKGIPRTEYMKSAWRHFMAWWTAHRMEKNCEEPICALIFNAMGYLHETLKEKQRKRHERKRI
jgi:uncharacterized NAD(P)/FAD-binding protein YdhS